MHDYSKLLGDTVRAAREKRGLTQSKVADLANIDTRTILNIENYRGNPKISVLIPLIRVLQIDPREFCYPEIQKTGYALQEMQLLLSECSDQELEYLLPVLRSVISILHSHRTTPI